MTDVIYPDEIWLPVGEILVRAPDGSNDTVQVEIEYLPFQLEPQEEVNST